MPELIFITSNSAKLSHAKHLCRNYAIRIVKQKNYGIGYNEPRIEDRSTLLRNSIYDAIKRFRKTVPNGNNKVFFIEDTSVTVNCLSKDKETPGVNVKYWMREMTFSKLDSILKENGNDRSVIVRSDIVLALSDKLKIKYKSDFLIFTSYLEGTISDRDYKVETHPLYPWLSGKTFNKWFVPKGSKLPLSMLSIAEADKFDFRAGAFAQMLQLLQGEKLIKTKVQYANLGTQSNLFEKTVFIICGPTCAGKTTLAKYLQDNYNYYHLEASDFMYLSYYDRHGLDPSVTIGDFAQTALSQNPSIVSDQIIQNTEKLNDTPFLITGFRSPKEIQSFIENYKGGLSVEAVYISANRTIRYNRCLVRGRLDVQNDISSFAIKDDQQYKMGLSIIEGLFQDKTIYNEDSLAELFFHFSNKYKSELIGSTIQQSKSIPKYFKSRSLQNTIILALSNADTEKYYTTTEISHLINDNDSIKFIKSKNNISRYFNQNFHPYFEISIDSLNKISYRLSQTGMSYAKWIERNLK